jgi:hypothetical protein
MTASQPAHRDAPHLRTPEPEGRNTPLCGTPVQSVSRRAVSSSDGKLTHDAGASTTAGLRSRRLAPARASEGPQTDRKPGFCGPFAVPIPTNSHEHTRAASREAQCFRGFSPMFACLRGSVRNRGVRFDLAFLCGFRAVCGLFAVTIPPVCHRVRVCTLCRALQVRVAH